MQTFPLTEVLETDLGKALFACEDIAKGAKVFRFTGKLVDSPNMHTVQLEETKHIVCQGALSFVLRFASPCPG